MVKKEYTKLKPPGVRHAVAFQRTVYNFQYQHTVTSFCLTLLTLITIVKRIKAN